MEAEALIVSEDQTASIEPIVVGDVGPNDVLVRTVCSGVSIGTEFALVRGKLNWGPYPLCTGYQNTGVVEQVGSEVQHLTVGDRVFTRGNKGPYTLRDGTPISCSGSHASYTLCDASSDSLQGPGIVPDGVDMGTASMFVMPSVALHGIDMAQPRAVDTVAVYGVGQIGMGVVALTALRGCRVIALDLNDSSLALAKEMGAEHTINVGRSDWRDEFDAVAAGGADVVFESTGIPACLETAVGLARHGEMNQVDGGAKFVYQGNYGAAPFERTFLPFHGRQLRCFYPCDDGYLPNRKRIMQLMSSGALRWDRVISHRVPYSDAPDVFAAINAGDRSYSSVVINWSDE